MTIPEGNDRLPTVEPSLDDPFITRKELVAGGAIFFGAIALIGAILLTFGDSGTDVPGNVQATGSVSPTASGDAPAGASGGLVIPQNADEQAIENLSRLSIILLPSGNWPNLYDDFTAEFQARCSEEDFAVAGEEGAAALGDSLSLLAFKGLQSVTVAGTPRRPSS